MLRVEGYKLILASCKNCIDFSNTLHDKLSTFIDPVHYRKEGSQILGSKIRELILGAMKENITQ